MPACCATIRAARCMAHVLGYVGAGRRSSELNGDPLLELPEFRIGKNGIEQSTTRRCAAAPGSAASRSTRSAARSASSTAARASPASDLQLTLDLDLQRYVHERLSGEQSASAPSCSTCARGEVLALASVPTFDPAAFASGLRRSVWRELHDQPAHAAGQQGDQRPVPAGLDLQDDVGAGGARGRRRRARPRGLLPGLTASSAQHTFHCWKQLGPRQARAGRRARRSPATSISTTSRAGSASTRSRAMARRFGLGDDARASTCRASSPGLMPDRAWKQATRGEPWQLGETLVVGIGQGFVQATPLQLAVMTARLANGGRAVRPRLVRAIRRPDARPRRRRCRRSASRTGRCASCGTACARSCNGARGTARAAARPARQGRARPARPAPRRCAGSAAPSARPGSARTRRSRWEERDHALFVAFAPYDDAALCGRGGGRARRQRQPGGGADRARHHGQGARARSDAARARR